MKNELIKKKQTIKTKLTENVKFHTFPSLSQQPNRLTHVETNEEKKKETNKEGLSESNYLSG